MKARALRHAPLCATIVLAVVGLAEITRLGLNVYRLHLPPSMPSAASALALQPSSGSNIARIVGGHLFGNAPAPAAPGEPQNAPDIGGTFLLSGVISSRDPKVGYAIVGRKGQATRLYQAGGLLVGLVSGRLYEVYEDHVILDLDGRFETLRLVRSVGGSGAVLQAAVSDTGRPDRPESTAATNPVIAPSSPARMFRNLNPVAKFARGHFGGLRLMPSVDDQQKFGVRNGDLVVAVNGVPLTNASAVNSLLTNQDDQHSTVSLTVVRDGAQQVIQMTNGN
ncbi:MAG TPA: type II secretion system protein N [Steroidobacteraceae bacterium]|jgi:type II secretion system protein C|nr:type II secretion system protein N [Steroidobacteraceae bacterium]